jgi:hypothetical protein
MRLQAAPPPADIAKVFSSARARSALDRVMGGLPPAFYTLDVGPDRVVVGPTGAFALARPEPNMSTALNRVARTAQSLRQGLARALSWAPFFDALVVVDEATSRTAGTVPLRLVEPLLTAGPCLIDESEVDRIALTLGRLLADPSIEKALAGTN